MQITNLQRLCIWFLYFTINVYNGYPCENNVKKVTLCYLSTDLPKCLSLSDQHSSLSVSHKILNFKFKSVKGIPFLTFYGLPQSVPLCFIFWHVLYILRGQPYSHVLYLQSAAPFPSETCLALKSLACNCTRCYPYCTARWYDQLSTPQCNIWRL